MTNPSVPTRFARFLQPVADPAGWTKESLAASQDWIHRLSEDERAELDAALAGIESRGFEITQITRDNFPLPKLGPVLDHVRAELIDGKGVFLLRGFPLAHYSARQTAAVYWGIGAYIGYAVAQNVSGHALGHVLDMFGDQEANDQQRDNHTSKRLRFHYDACDVVALLCLHPARSGGTSSVVSSITLHNEMLKRRPEFAAEFAAPWYHTRRGDLSQGRKPWFEVPLFNYRDDHFSMNLGIGNYEFRYEAVRARFPELPPYSKTRSEAVVAMEELANELCFDMELESGDIQFLHNHVTLHARTRFEDYEEREKKRHLLRLWLATPEGRPLPEAYWDRFYDRSNQQRPSGVQASGPLTVPIEPEYAETRDYESFKQRAQAD